MTAYSGKAWFRANIAPYLTEIKNSIGGGGYPPMVMTQDKTEITTNTVNTVTLTGEFFTPDTTVTCGTATITNVVFIGAHSMTFDIEASTGQTNTLAISSPAGSTTITILSAVEVWVDLRAGSGATFTETHRSGTTVIRDTEGLSSNGSLWSNWLKIPSHSWSRSTPKTLSFIVKHSGTAHMAGIMSEAQNENSPSQYYQADIYAYFPSNYLWGFYGQNASGSGASNPQSGGTTLSGYDYYKIVLEHNGEVGEAFSLYGLSDLTDFGNTSNLLESGTVGSAMTADGTTLTPSVTFGSPNLRLVAFKLEDV